MVPTATDVLTINRISHDEAMSITAVENAEFLEQLRTLDEHDWPKPAACDR